MTEHAGSDDEMDQAATRDEATRTGADRDRAGLPEVGGDGGDGPFLAGGDDVGHSGGRAVRRRRGGCWIGALVVGVGALATAAAVGLALRAGGDALLRGPVGRLYLSLVESELAAPGGDPGEVAFTVEPGEPVRDIASRLAAIGLVRDADAFVALAQVSGADRRIQAGSHALSAAMTAAEVLDALAVARAAEVQVTLPEGWRAEEVADALATAGVVDRAAFLALVAAPDDTLEVPPVVAARGVPSLEGYLYPDTYRFAPASGAPAALRKLLATFAARVPADLNARSRAVGLASGHEAVILASIVQREGVRVAELPQIARVYLNRLASPPYILNADPTLQYALGFQSDPPPGTWWKRPLYDVDKQVDSPYNSYQRGGLPPGPIASPGLAAIEAVLAPADGPWMYFVASPACDGTHVFAETYDEHLTNVAAYVESGCGGR